MSKILLVEDDNNLREIYEARLQAEGYDIVSARDGEEALTVAMKERPDLIISDVMMPKISGFDMLDIIRSTEETKNVKVIMMTALSQAEDKARAEKLGADRYLVKSQVTLEDVAKVAREVLSGESSPAPSAPAPVTTPAPAPAPAAEILTPAPLVASPDPAPTPTVSPAPEPTTNDDSNAINPALSAVVNDDAPDEPVASTQNSTDEDTAIAAQIESFIDSKKTSSDTATPTVEPPVENSVVEVPSADIPSSVAEDKPAENSDDASAATQTGKKIIQPISDPTASKESDLNNLLEKEKEKEQMAEIARNLVSEKAEVVDELTAEAALRSAARNPQTELSEENTSEVKITEDGDLKVESPPIETPVVEDTAPPVDTSDVPSVALPTPVAPTSNGTNIDGVVPTTPPANDKPANGGVDPDLISL
jgi:CheY-like chemotaxis protein